MTHQNHLVLCLYIKYSKKLVGMVWIICILHLQIPFITNQQLLKNIHHEIRRLNYMTLTDYLNTFRVTKKAARKQTGASLLKAV